MILDSVRLTPMSGHPRLELPLFDVHRTLDRALHSVARGPWAAIPAGTVNDRNQAEADEAKANRLEQISVARWHVSSISYTN